MRMAHWAAPMTAALILAGCGAEQRCDRKIDDLHEEYRRLHNMEDGRHKQQPDVVRAGEHVNAAITQQATQNFEGCVDSLKEAERALSRARRAIDG